VYETFLAQEISSALANSSGVLRRRKKEKLPRQKYISDGNVDDDTRFTSNPAQKRFSPLTRYTYKKALFK
jgi:hypothetical protein